jgi:pimeloyl-ACP methyl ester carboxylesterase
MYPGFAIDFCGWGDSTGPHLPVAYSISNLADDIQLLVTWLPQITEEGFVLVGHSMGGKVAQLLASCHLPGLKDIFLVAPAPAAPIILPLEEMKEQQMKVYDTPGAAEFIACEVLSAGSLEDNDV